MQKSMGVLLAQNGGRNHAESGTLVLVPAKHMAECLNSDSREQGDHVPNLLLPLLTIDGPRAKMPAPGSPIEQAGVQTCSAERPWVPKHRRAAPLLLRQAADGSRLIRDSAWETLAWRLMACWRVGDAPEKRREDRGLV